MFGTKTNTFSLAVRQKDTTDNETLHKKYGM